MLTWKDVQVQREFRRAEIERAAHERLLAQIDSRPGLLMALVRSMVVRFGAWMEVTGCRLQTRYQLALTDNGRPSLDAC
jgi:hypothetical protein